jgi:hypothetical protein
MRLHAAIIGCALAVAACRSDKSAAVPAEGAGTTSADRIDLPAARAPATTTPATPTPTTPTPAKVTASVRQSDRGDVSKTTLIADIKVEVDGSAHGLSLTGEFDNSCETKKAPVEQVPALKDDRLWMVQLFCERGEDFFSRQMITALVLADSAPKVLWQGKGSFANSNGECDYLEYLHFRPGPKGTVEAVLRSGCTDSERTSKVVATIKVPAPG